MMIPIADYIILAFLAALAIVLIVSPIIGFRQSKHWWELFAPVMIIVFDLIILATIVTAGFALMGLDYVLSALGGVKGVAGFLGFVIGLTGVGLCVQRRNILLAIIYLFIAFFLLAIFFTWTGEFRL